MEAACKARAASPGAALPLCVPPACIRRTWPAVSELWSLDSLWKRDDNIIRHFQTSWMRLCPTKGVPLEEDIRMCNQLYITSMERPGCPQTLHDAWRGAAGQGYSGGVALEGDGWAALTRRGGGLPPSSEVWSSSKATVAPPQAARQTLRPAEPRGVGR